MKAHSHVDWQRAQAMADADVVRHFSCRPKPTILGFIADWWRTGRWRAKASFGHGSPKLVGAMDGDIYVCLDTKRHFFHINGRWSAPMQCPDADIVKRDGRWTTVPSQELWEKWFISGSFRLNNLFSR